MLGVTLALVSALVWGAADFAGGLASRRGHPFQILALNGASGIVLLSLFAAITGEAVPSVFSALWAASAGLAGAIGIAALYRGLATGSAALVAPTSGVITAIIPVVFSMLTRGQPTLSQQLGFAVAAIGIWLVASGPAGSGRKLAGLELAIVAGLGFGCFLILIAQVPESQVFGPLAVARVVTFTASLSLLLWSRTPPMPPRALLPMALLAGALDAGGNVFYLLARQHVRLDVAAVLSSFYPVATVALSRLVLKESVSGLQWAGALACLAAVGLITR